MGPTAPRFSCNALRSAASTGLPSAVAVEPLAIDAHAGGDDEPVEGPALRAFDHRFQKHRGAAPVDVGVVGDLVHALADPDPRGKMDHRVDIGQRPAHRPRRADIADDQLDAAVEIRRRPTLFPMDLRVETIERLDRMAVFQQQRGAVRANKAGPAGNQNRLSHRAPDVLCDVRQT